MLRYSLSLPVPCPSPALTRRRVHNDFLRGGVNDRQGQGRLHKLAPNVELELERLQVDKVGVRHDGIWLLVWVEVIARGC